MEKLILLISIIVSIILALSLTVYSIHEAGCSVSPGNKTSLRRQERKSLFLLILSSRISYARTITTLSRKVNFFTYHMHTTSYILELRVKYLFFESMMILAFNHDGDSYVTIFVAPFKKFRLLKKMFDSVTPKKELNRILSIFKDDFS